MAFAAHIAPIAGAVELVCGSIAPLLSSEAELAHLHHAHTVLADLLAAVQRREGGAPGDDGAAPLATIPPVDSRAVSRNTTPKVGSLASSRTGSQSGARSGSARFTPLPLSRTGSGGLQPARNAPVTAAPAQPMAAKQSVSLMGKSDHERLELQAQMLAAEDHDEQQVELQRDRSGMGFIGMVRRRSQDRTSSTSSFAGERTQSNLRRMDSMPLPSRALGSAAASRTASRTSSMRGLVRPGTTPMPSPAIGGHGGGRLGAELLTAGAAPERRGSLQRDEHSRILEEASMLAEVRSQERDGEETQNDGSSAGVRDQNNDERAIQEEGVDNTGSAPSADVPHRTASASLNFFSRWAGTGSRSASDAPGVAQVAPLSAAQAAEETLAKRAADKDGGEARHASQTSARSVAFDASVADSPKGQRRDLFGSSASLEPGQIRTPGGSARFLSQRDVDPYNTVLEGDDVWVRQKKRQAALLLKYEHGLLFKDEGVIHPDSRPLRYWNMCIFAWVLYSAIMVPLSLGFNIDKSNWVWIDCIMEVQLLGDIYINLHTGYVDKHTTDVVLDMLVIRPHYLKGWFLIDACGSVPVELIAVIGGGAMSNLIFLKILRLSKVFRLVRLMHLKLLDDLEQDGLLNPSLLRLFKLIASFILVIHFITCAYWGIVRVEGPHSLTAEAAAQYGDADTLLQWLPDETTWDAGLGRRYMHSLHWAIMSLLGGDTMPQSSLELLFTVGMLLLGIIVFASIVGSASSLLANLDAYAEAKKTQLDSVKQYLRYRRVGKALQNKICLYFEYLWISGQSVHHKRLFDELPESLSLMLNLSLKRKLIENCPMFRECTAVSVVAVIRRLIPCIALPQEMIVRQGDRGDRMFFVVRGALQVFLLQPNGNRIVVNSLGEGAQFGELALLAEDNERTACVVALTFCELEVLTDVDFHELELQYPDIASHVRKIAQDNASRVRRQAQRAPSRRGLVDETEASPRSLASRLMKAAAARMPSMRHLGSTGTTPASPNRKLRGSGKLGKRNSLIGNGSGRFGKRNSLVDPGAQQKADEVMEAARKSLAGISQSERLSGASAMKDEVDSALKAIRSADGRRISTAASAAPAAQAPAAHAPAAHAPAAQRPSGTGIEQDLQQIVELHQRSGRSRMSVDSTAAAPAHEPASPSKPGNTKSWDQSK